MNSIMMPAVRVNQIAAKTGAVVRNFFMVSCKGLTVLVRTGSAGDQRGETVTLLSASTNLPPVNSRRAANGQEAAATVLLKARGRSI